MADISPAFVDCSPLKRTLQAGAHETKDKNPSRIPPRPSARRTVWNKGKPVGQKAPLRLREIWAIRIRLQLGQPLRELARFNLAVDSKLRSCDLVKLLVRPFTHGDRVAARAI